MECLNFPGGMDQPSANPARDAAQHTHCVGYRIDSDQFLFFGIVQVILKVSLW